jgi:hypothetical protein
VRAGRSLRDVGDGGGGAASAGVSSIASNAPGVAALAGAFVRAGGKSGRTFGITGSDTTFCKTFVPQKGARAPRMV